MRSTSLALLLLLGLGACNGAIDEPRESSDLVTPDGDGTETPAEEEPLVLGSERLRLLPFSVRLARVAAVLGVSVDAPVLEPLTSRAVELGAPDYAAGIQADGIWNASKISIWADALESICGSAEMHARYPSFPESLSPLIEAAYGRRMSADDETSLEPIQSAAIDPERKYVLTCMTVLSAAEMVLQ